MEKYLNIAQTTEYLGISKSMLYRLMGSGAIPHLKIGARTMFCIDDLDGFMDECRVN